MADVTIFPPHAQPPISNTDQVVHHIKVKTRPNTAPPAPPLQLKVPTIKPPYDPPTATPTPTPISAPTISTSPEPTPEPTPEPVLLDDDEEVVNRDEEITKVNKPVKTNKKPTGKRSR